MLKHLLGVLAVSLVACQSRVVATKEDAAPAAPLPKEAEPVVESPIQRLSKASTLQGALDITTPMMEDPYNKLDDGTALLAYWSAAGLKWTDVYTAKNEVSFAAVLKDPDEARGKRMCFAGSIIQIEVEKTKWGKVFDGLFHDYSQNLYKFSAVRGTGDLVAQSQARFCGVVTGKYDYANSGGGTGHAIKVVGIFDLPENKKAKSPANP